MKNRGSARCLDDDRYVKVEIKVTFLICAAPNLAATQVHRAL
jgi:hypothetical protein